MSSSKWLSVEFVELISHIMQNEFEGTGLGRLIGLILL